MRAFWWFKQEDVAGMARPGFNGIHWFDMPFEESIVFAWIGQRTNGTYSLTSFKSHLREYGSMAMAFFKMDQSDLEKVIQLFDDVTYLKNMFSRVAYHSKCVEDIKIEHDQIAITLNRQRLDYEIEYLKKNGFGTVVTLTENHNQKDELSEHFDLHHLAIYDMNPPTFEQAQHLAEIIRTSRAQNKKVAVHCMAGIGRTSTMLISAHLILGENFDELKALVQKQNPTYKLSGSQFEFVNAVAKRLQR